MAFCTHCGVPARGQYCGTCGAPTNAAVAMEEALDSRVSAASYAPAPGRVAPPTEKSPLSCIYAADGASAMLRDDTESTTAVGELAQQHLRVEVVTFRIADSRLHLRDFDAVNERAASMTRSAPAKPSVEAMVPTSRATSNLPPTAVRFMKALSRA